MPVLSLRLACTFGLSSRGLALPAAIAAALHESAPRAVAFAGDGGLAMCLGELATAAEYRLPMLVIAFNEAQLALIVRKTDTRKVPDGSPDWRPPDLMARGHAPRPARSKHSLQDRALAVRLARSAEQRGAGREACLF